MPTKENTKQADPKASVPVAASSVAKPAASTSVIAPTAPSAPLGSKPKSKLKDRMYFRVVLGVVASLVVVLIIGLITVAIGIYQFNWQNSFSKTMAKTFGLPAAFINFKSLSYKTYANDVATLDHYYAYQLAQGTGATKPSDQYIQKSVLSRMVREKFLADSAKKFNLTVTQDEVNTEYNTIVTQAGSESNVQQTLQELYQWTPDQFKEKVLEPYLIRTKVQTYVAKDDTINAAAKAKAEEVLAKLNSGTSFEDLAKQYSEDTTASTGGDLGYFSKGQMVQEFEDAAFALEVGKTSGIIKTMYGYHIIKLLERVAATSDKAEQLHAAHILIKSIDIDTWINQELAKEKVFVPFKGLSWKKDCGLILASSETCDNNELVSTTSEETTNTETTTNTNSDTNTNSNTNE